MIYLQGDLNTQLGRNMDRWYPNPGKFGIGKESGNGYRLL